MSKTILVVDDSPSELKLMVSALEGRGYNLVTAVDGEQAIERAFSRRPDLILLDVVLPKRNGYQVCRQIKAEGQKPNPKIIMLSSKNQESDRFWGFKQGADFYLTKPLDPGDLAATVDRVL